MADNTTNMELMSLRMDNMEKKLEEIDEKLDALTKKLLDPDDGFVTRVNKNTAFRRLREEEMPYLDEMIEDFNDVKKWKDNVSKALWILFTAIVGVIIKLIFFA
tara:strand:- start:2489 stop:2800 length:312 start_codon:yes stop_codon:yes gene_type:complete